MSITKLNPLLGTDVYKMSHMEMYAPGTTKVYSYLCARSDKNFNEVLYFGLQYYLKEYLSTKLTPEMGEEFISYKTMITGECSEDVKHKIRSLCKLGYFPIKIKSIREGSIIPPKNALFTITNTLPEYYWVVGFVESLLIKVWYPTTVATCSLKYRRFVDAIWSETVDDSQLDNRFFAVHDFGYRGDTSEEGAGISGAAHLLNFLGSDTVLAHPFVDRYYDASLLSKSVMLSVPASEHSVMCSYGRDNEFEGFSNIIDKYPKGIVSIVSDTFNVYTVLTDFVARLKDKILARNGTVVFRPDSGNPEYVICGDPNADPNSPEGKGCIRLLDEMFGSTVNSKGYKVLNPKVGLIYGDGMYFARYETVMNRLKSMGYAASNLVIGVGGILRNHSRDTLGFAIKATYVEVNGESREIEKDPYTDKGKKSHKGLFKVSKEDGVWVTKDRASLEEEDGGLLELVFLDGELIQHHNFHNIRTF